MFKNILFSMILLVSSVLANTLSLQDNSDGTWNVNYSSVGSIGGFQFNVDDVPINSAFGGEADANGFFISTNGTMVLGFSLTGATIPAQDNGILTILHTLGDGGTPYYISSTISDAAGSGLGFVFDE